MEGPKLGRYQIKQELGRGGFAVVYLAHDTLLHRDVALKVLHSTWVNNPEFVKRFQREARAVSQLKHPHIVTVFDYGESNGQIYIAMEYVRGQTLESLLSETDKLPLEDTMTILNQMADALDFAHSFGVVHRDLKPNNIMVEMRDSGPHVTLLDFGLVKVLGQSALLTSVGTMLGTPEYMAPEQADYTRADEIDSAADRYILGVVAYRMLTGRVPFPGNTPATLLAHIQADVPSAGRINPDLPSRVNTVLQRMLAKQPPKRYTTAADFVGALRQAITEVTSSKIAVPVRAPATYAVAAGALSIVLILLIWLPRIGGDGGTVAEQTPPAAADVTWTTSPNPTTTRETAAAAAFTGISTRQRSPTATPSRTAATFAATATPAPATPTNIPTTPTDIPTTPTNISATPTDIPTTPTNISATPTDIPTPQTITLVDPINCVNPANYRDTISIDFRWTYDGVMRSDQYLEVRVEPNPGIASQGKVTEPLEGNLWHQAVSVSNFNTGAGYYEWYVVLMGNDGTREMKVSDSKGCFTIWSDD